MKEIPTDPNGERRIVLTNEQLWSLVREYVIYLNFHNQTSKVKDLNDSMQEHKAEFGQGLEPMLNFMSRHGMPHQFPGINVFLKVFFLFGNFNYNFNVKIPTGTIEKYSSRMRIKLCTC